MQVDVGRKGVIDALNSDEGKILPGYYWDVQYFFDELPGREFAFFSDRIPVFRIKLTMDGKVWSFSNNLNQVEEAIPYVGQGLRVINRAALASAFSHSESDSVLAATESRLRAVTDSTLRASLSFSGVRSGTSRRIRTENNISRLIDEALLIDLESGDPVELDTQAVYSIARFYEPENLVGKIEWKIDSLQVIAGSEAQQAKIWLVSTTPVLNQDIRLDVTVTSLGSLHEMDVVYNPGENNDDLTSTAFAALMAAAYLILAIVLIVVFFRRIMARLIDVKSALIDAVVMGIFFGLYAILSLELGLGQGPTPIWIQVLGTLVLFSLVAGAMSLFVFIISAVTESAVREVWPEKWLSLVLIRKGDIRNTDVGWSIVRGIALAGVILGLGVLAITVSPSLVMDMSQDLQAHKSLRPVLSAVTGNAVSGFLLMLMLMVGIGSYAYRVKNRTWMAVLAITLFGGVLQIAPFSLTIGAIPIVVSALVACLLALALFQYDFFTVFLGYVIARIFWQLSEGFLIAGSPTWFDATLAVVALGVFLGMGIIGLLSGKSGGDMSQFLPEYITELASQERVKRELEIAHQVQSSFLPRRMPDINGMDIAGMCLPATEVGGDYFDFIKISDHKLAVVVGDVSGKGIEAAFYMTFVKGVIQTLSTSIESPAEVMRRANAVFGKNAPAGIFISMIYGVVDVASNTFTFARAGHNPVILKRNGIAEAEPLQPQGMAIGFPEPEIFNRTIEEKSILLNTGDTLVFYTDGFSEAMNSSRELYGDDRLVEKVARVGSKGSGAILRALTEDVHHFIEGHGRSDDMTMVVIKMTQ